MEGGPGRLPRTTFIDDPFFNHDPFEGFPPREGGFQRSPLPQRRFGSTPRLIDDEPDFFDDFRYQMPFGSLPRRQENRSPRPPTNRNDPNDRFDRFERQERQIPVQRTSPNGSSAMPPTGQQQHHPASQQFQPQQQAAAQQNQQQQQKKSPVPKAAIEINNATNSNYTNGELNPDRYQPPAADCPNPIVIKEVSLESTKPVAEKRNSNSSVDSKKDEAIPLPPPITVKQTTAAPQNITVNKNETAHGQAVDKKRDVPKPASSNLVSNGTNVGAKRQIFGDKMNKSMSIDVGADHLIHLLDDAERGVEQLREMAAKLEEQREMLLRSIRDVHANAGKHKLSQNDHEDIVATAGRLLTRCEAVTVNVFTPRNELQHQALEEVTKLIENITSRMEDDFAFAKDSIQRFLNACCPDDEPGPIDQRFQSRVIECTADDQKKIRRRLNNILEDIEKAVFMNEYSA